MASGPPSVGSVGDAAALGFNGDRDWSSVAIPFASTSIVGEMVSETLSGSPTKAAVAILEAVRWTITGTDRVAVACNVLPKTFGNDFVIERVRGQAVVKSNCDEVWIGFAAAGTDPSSGSAFQGLKLASGGSSLVKRCTDGTTPVDVAAVVGWSDACIHDISVELRMKDGDGMMSIWINGSKEEDVELAYTPAANLVFMICAKAAGSLTILGAKVVTE